MRLQKVQYIVDGVFVLPLDDQEFFFTDKMLADNVYIDTYDFAETDDIDEELQDVIEVVHVTDSDAVRFTVYFDRVLGRIQMYRILKDIVELHETNALPDFLHKVHYLASSVTAASYIAKSDFARSHGMREYAQKHLEMLKYADLRQGKLGEE
jgi:replication fork clamp-binding protein CrfC